MTWFVKFTIVNFFSHSFPQHGRPCFVNIELLQTIIENFLSARELAKKFNTNHVYEQENVL